MRELAGRAGAVALLVLAAALRFWRLGDADIWWDEGLAVWAVRKGLVAATFWTASDVHPPLFFWLLWGWRRLTGESEFALRALVALQGTGLAAVTYALGRRAGGRAGGHWALALAATAPFLVWWSRELRMYTTAALAAALAAYAAARWIAAPKAPAARRWLAAYVAAGAAVLYSVYLAGAALAALSAAVVILALRRRLSRAAFGHWLLAQAAVLTLFLPWAMLAGGRMDSWRTIAAGPTPAFVAELWAALLAHGRSTELAAARGATLAFWMAVAGAWAIGAWGARWRRARGARAGSMPADAAADASRSGARAATSGAARAAAARADARLLLGSFLSVPPVLVWLVTQPRSLFYSPALEARYVLPFAAPVVALIGAWIARAVGPSRRAEAPGGAAEGAGAPSPDRPRRGRPWAGAACGLVALGVGLAGLGAPLAGRRRTAALPTMALAIWSQAEPDDVVLLVSGNRYPLFLYHYERAWDRPARAPRYEFPAEAPPRRADMPRVVPFPSRGSDLIAGGADVDIAGGDKDGADDGATGADSGSGPGPGPGSDAGLDPGWRDRLTELTAGHARVWLVEYGRDLQDPGDAVEAWLAARLPRVLSEGYGPDALHLFAREGRPPRVRALSSRWPGTAWLGRLYEPLGATGTWTGLVGLPTRRARAGDALELTLFATADEPPAAQRAWLTAYPEARRFVAVRAGLPVDGPAPGAEGAPARRRFTVPIDARVPGGGFALGLVPQGGAGVLGPGVPVTVLGAPTVVSGPNRLSGFPRAGDFILESARWDTDLPRPGQALTLDLEWAPLTGVPAPPRPPIVFAHLVGPPRADGDPVWAGQDGPPSIGGWDVGGVRRFDRHVLTLAPDAPPGDYEIEVGLYDPATGARLPVDGDPLDVDAAARRIVLGRVTVR